MQRAENSFSEDEDDDLLNGDDQEAQASRKKRGLKILSVKVKELV